MIPLVSHCDTCSKKRALYHLAIASACAAHHPPCGWKPVGPDSSQPIKPADIPKLTPWQPSRDCILLIGGCYSPRPAACAPESPPNFELPLAYHSLTCCKPARPMEASVMTAATAKRKTLLAKPCKPAANHANLLQPAHGHTVHTMDTDSIKGAPQPSSSFGPSHRDEAAGSPAAARWWDTCAVGPVLHACMSRAQRRDMEAAFMDFSGAAASQLSARISKRQAGSPVQDHDVLLANALRALQACSAWPLRPLAPRCQGRSSGAQPFPLRFPLGTHLDVALPMIVCPIAACSRCPEASHGLAVSPRWACARPGCSRAGPLWAMPCIAAARCSRQPRCVVGLRAHRLCGPLLPMPNRWMSCASPSFPAST